jgi:hypothetical protein
MPRGVYERRPSLLNNKNTTTKTPKKKPTIYTKTCPTCAETFKAKRKDKVFCCNLHRTYFNQDDIPKAIQVRANELREKRTDRLRVAKEKREADKARHAAHLAIRKKALELYLEVCTQSYNDLIETETDPDQRLAWVEARDENIERLKSADCGIPDRYWEQAKEA